MYNYTSTQLQEKYSISIWRVSYFDDIATFSLLTDDTAIPEGEDADTNSATAKLHQGRITCLSFRPPLSEYGGSAVLASGSTDQTVRLWHFNDDGVLKRYHHHEEEHHDGFFAVRDIHNRLHNAPVTAVCFSDRGSLMASSSKDNTIVVWKFRKGEAISIHQTVCGGRSFYHILPVLYLFHSIASYYI